MNGRKGFTLIELLLYVAIFALVGGMFTGILVTILRIEGQQSGLLEVSGQLNFVMGRVQGLIREAKTSPSPSIGPSVSTLTLSTDSGSNVISLSSGAILVNGESITTGKVKVDDLKFTKYTISNPSTELALPDIVTIEIEMTLSNVTDNPANKVTRTLKSSASPISK